MSIARDVTVCFLSSAGVYCKVWICWCLTWACAMPLPREAKGKEGGMLMEIPCIQLPAFKLAEMECLQYPLNWPTDAAVLAKGPLCLFTHIHWSCTRSITLRNLNLTCFLYWFGGVLWWMKNSEPFPSFFPFSSFFFSLLETLTVPNQPFSCSDGGLAAGHARWPLTKEEASWPFYNSVLRSTNHCQMVLV